MKPFDTLVFDLDGTLADPVEGFTRCIAHAFEVVGLPPPMPAKIERRIGPPLEDTFRALGAPPDQVEPLVAAYRDRYRDAGIFENRLYPEIHPCLASLVAAGYQLHVATSKPAVFAETILDHFAIRSFFTTVAGSNLDGTLSHKRDLLLEVQRRTRFDPGCTAMVGDRRYDMEAAVDVGVTAIGAGWGYGSRDELESSGAAIWVAAPEALTDAIGRLRPRHARRERR